jgi:hypothetical protein
MGSGPFVIFVCKGEEVVGPNEVRDGRLEKGEVDGGRKGSKSVLKGVTLEAEPILVDLPCCTVAGMKGGRDGVDGKEPDLGGEKGVDGEQRGEVWGVDMGGLAPSMDSRVGPTCSSYGNRVT